MMLLGWEIDKLQWDFSGISLNYQILCSSMVELALAALCEQKPNSFPAV